MDLLGERQFSALILGHIFEIVAHNERILEAPQSHIGALCELRVVLVHLLEGAWHLIEPWQSKVTLLEDVLLVELGNALDIGPLPPVIHDGAV